MGLELRAASSSRRVGSVVELEAGSGGCKEETEVGQEEGGSLEAVYVEAVGSTDGAEVGLEEGRANKRPSPSVEK